jgi:hypothetical protein
VCTLEADKVLPEDQQDVEWARFRLEPDQGLEEAGQEQDPGVDEVADDAVEAAARAAPVMQESLGGPGNVEVRNPQCCSRMRRQSRRNGCREWGCRRGAHAMSWIGRKVGRSAGGEAMSCGEVGELASWAREVTFEY